MDTLMRWPGIPESREGELGSNRLHVELYYLKRLKDKGLLCSVLLDWCNFQQRQPAVDSPLMKYQLDGSILRCVIRGPSNTPYANQPLSCEIIIGDRK